MCGNTETNPKSGADGLAKLAGITPPGYADFNVGDRVSGRSNRGDPSSEVTGVIKSFDSTSSTGVAVLTLDDGSVRSVWNSTLIRKPANPASVFKIGDYVSGSDRSDGSNRKTGTIDGLDDVHAHLQLDDGRGGWWVTRSSLQFAERPASSTISGQSASITIVDDISPAPASPAWPVLGSVDFNKPLEAADSDYTMEDIKVVAHVPGASYPFVVSFTDGSNITLIHTFDEDGDNEHDSDYNLKNAAEMPAQVFGRLLKDDDDDLFFDDATYETEQAARDAYTDNTIISVFPVQTKPGAPTSASATSSDDDDGDGDDDGKDGLTSISLYISGQTRTIRPGDSLYATRRGYGRRRVKVVKIRDHRSKNLLLQPEDGSNRYWALNKNVSAY